MSIYLYLIFLCLTVSIGWLKGNLKLLTQINWEPWHYWLFLGLPQTYLGLYGWWGLLEKLNNDVWRCVIISSCVGILVNLTLNSIFWGVNYRAAVALLLISVAGIVGR